MYDKNRSYVYIMSTYWKKIEGNVQENVAAHLYADKI